MFSILSILLPTTGATGYGNNIYFLHYRVQDHQKGRNELNTQFALIVGRNCMTCTWQRKTCSLRKSYMATVPNEELFVKSDRW